MNISGRQTYIWLGIAIGAIAILFLTWQPVETFVHAFVNIFATGRTGVKPFLFLIYALFFCAVLCIRWGKLPKGVISNKSDKSIIVLYSVIVISFIYNLVLNLWIVIAHHVPLLTYSVFYGNGTFTSSQLIHNHITKGSIAVILKWLPQDLFLHTDTGRALLGIVPDTAFYVQAVLTLIVIIAISIVWWKKSAKICEMNRRLAYSVLFVVSSFMIVKSMLDGGFLSFEAIVGLTFFLLIIGPASKKYSVFAVVMIGGYSIVLSVLYCIGYFATDVAFGSHVYAFFSALIFFIAIYSFYIHGMTRLSKLIAIFAIIPFGMQFYNNSMIISYSNTPIDSKDGAYVLSYNQESGTDYTLLDTIGRLRVYVYHPSENRTIHYIIGRTGFVDNMTPISIPWQTCMPNGPDTIFKFILRSRYALSETDMRSEIYSLSAKPVSSRDGDYTYDVTISMPACFGMQPLVVAEEMVANSLSEFSTYNFDHVDRDHDIDYGFIN